MHTYVFITLPKKGFSVAIFNWKVKKGVLWLKFKKQNTELSIASLQSLKSEV